MSLFQNSVLKKHLLHLNQTDVDRAFKKFTAYFQDSVIQQNIRNSKEEQYQEGFLRELFVNILEYKLNPSANFNLTTEYKNEKGAKKADGAILQNDVAIAVIELKSTKTRDLESIRKQAFDYKSNQSNCKYVITSNFEKLRFYIDNAVDNEEFNLFTMNRNEFSLLYICLHSQNLLADLPFKIKNDSIAEEEIITKRFYSDYSVFKRELYRDLVVNNLNNSAIAKHISNSTEGTHTTSTKLNLFIKSQKLIDRFLFILFSEDRGLLAPNSIIEVLKDWDKLVELDAAVPLYDRFKLFFEYLDTGREGTDNRAEVFAYNGGLFKPDAILDNMLISDDLIYKHASLLSNYDFVSQVDVNILGHIFENSLNEIENVNAQITGGQFDKQTTKRKKDGIYYTPKYVTKYIVDSTIGATCEKKKKELKLDEQEYFKPVKGRKKAKLKELKTNLDRYRDWLLKVTICDPACGSGAFLNQALDFLIREHQYIDELEASLFGGGLVFRNIENTILENNIFGVDINEESVEIAKLSLWLRTAQPRRKLSDLNNNIKCGNSIISDKAISNSKAFNWQCEFPSVFANNGFDIVIGNPPYGAFISDKEKTHFAASFATYQGNHEIYFFFIELISIILKDGGHVGYITPDTWIKIPQAQKLREHVLATYALTKLVAFNYPVFSDASVNALICIAVKSSSDQHCEVIIADDAETKLQVSKSQISVCDTTRWSNSTDKQFQIWQSESDIKLISKIRKKSTSAIDHLDVCQGIVPYSKESLTKEEIKNRIYHSDTPQSGNWDKWVQGRAIRRYAVDVSNAEYLNYGDWLHRSRKPKYFSGERILIQEITGGNPPRINAAIYINTLYHDPGIISCLNNSNFSTEFLLAVINSRLISWYTVKNSPKGKRKTFPKVLIGDIRQFPIVTPTAKMEQSIKREVKKQLHISELIIKNSNSFLNYVSASLNIRIASKKLAAWHEISSHSFIVEIRRQLKLHKINALSKNEEFEWMEVFEEKKKIVNDNIRLAIYNDNKIDDLVFQAYGLSKNEIDTICN